MRCRIEPLADPGLVSCARWVLLELVTSGNVTRH